MTEQHGAIDSTTNTTPTMEHQNQVNEQTLILKPKHFNHKKWKAYLKKMKRKQKRSAAAKERDLIENNDDPKSNSEEEREKEEYEGQKQHQLWLERERQAEAAFKAKKEWEEYERRRKEEIERKIKEEWEERERKEKEEKEANEKSEQEKRLKQDKLLKEATANENTGAWHNPIAPVQYGTERQVDSCPFFKKMAACRFGDHCSRYHHYPEVSKTILIPNMFSSFQLEQSIVDNYDTDIGLEYDENELYQSFKEFYEDILPEFKSVGTILQLKVCCNCEPHLRGNVYVQYKRESAAQKAYEKFNARWYGGRQLTCIFVSIESWKSAICGLASKKRCPKGKACNFLHVFRNPRGEFTELDYEQGSTIDNQNSRDSSQRHNSRDSVNNNNNSYSRRQSVSSQRSSRHRSRSPSRSNSSRTSSRHRSRSESRSRSYRYRKSKSRSSPLESRHRASPDSRHSKNKSSSKIPRESEKKSETSNNSKMFAQKQKHSSSSSSSSGSSCESEERPTSKDSKREKKKRKTNNSPKSGSDEEIIYEYIEKTKETLHQQFDL